MLPSPHGSPRHSRTPAKPSEVETYILRAGTVEESRDWGDALHAAADECRRQLKERYDREHGWSERLRVFLDNLYRDKYVQAFLCFIILGCFASSIASTAVTLEDQDDRFTAAIDMTELCFAAFFIASRVKPA